MSGDGLMRQDLLLDHVDRLRNQRDAALADLARAQATLAEQHTEPVDAHCEPGIPCFPFGCDGPVSCRCRCHALDDCDCTTCRLARAQATIAAAVVKGERALDDPYRNAALNALTEIVADLRALDGTTEATP